MLDNLDMSLRLGQRIGLCAPNGAGKTTLFRCITGLAGISSGKIVFHGRIVKGERDFVSLRKKVGFVLQNAEDQLFFPTVLEDAAFGPLNLGFSMDEAQAMAMSSLVAVGLAGFEHRLVHQLSGGQQKLLALAGIMAMDPEILLLDEPTAGLDENATRNLEELLRSSDRAMVIVSHDRAFLGGIAEECLTMRNGRLAPVDS